jgi:hypothetical protein
MNSAWSESMQPFISYSFKDKARFDDVCFALESHGIKPWSTSEIAAGESLRDKLRSAIESCAVCVFIATRASLASGWCQAEIGAFWGAGKPVVVYLADGELKEEEMPRQFQGDKWTNSTRELVDSVKRHLSFAAKTRVIQRPANLFWLGHDIAWSIAHAMFEEERNQLAKDLRQTIHHLDEIGIEAPDVRKLLLEAIRTNRAGGPAARERDEFVTSIALARTEIGDAIIALQPGFRGFPDRASQNRFEKELANEQADA